MCYGRTEVSASRAASEHGLRPATQREVRERMTVSPCPEADQLMATHQRPAAWDYGRCAERRDDEEDHAGNEVAPEVDSLILVVEYACRVP